ncbi:MAG TPA: site-specific DNA-methyltransferase [Bryobacteraceae bacterium]
MATRVGRSAKTGRAKAAVNGAAKNYRHPEAESLLRPDVGTQAQFKKKKEPRKYHYDSSLAPSLDWDGQNPAREQGEALIREILDAKTLEGAKGAADKLRKLSKPFLNWAGKAERLSFHAPTLPLFVHERLSTKAILETVKGHKRDKQLDMLDLFGDPGHSITDQVLKAYEHRDKWVNRIILGDSLVVMNSLLEYEGLGGKVQMIYMDPPYGVKFGSNFQPFVRKRDVTHGDDADMTREPETVQAYRDTWELGLHSYLTYLRDRLLLCRELLASSGSVFVQISDENLHHVRELMDDVFGAENFLSVITVRKTTSEGTKFLGTTADFILLYARDRAMAKCRQIYTERSEGADNRYDQVMLADGLSRPASEAEMSGTRPLPFGARLFRVDNITSSRPAGEGDVREFEHEGRRFRPGAGTFKTDLAGLQRLGEAGRLHVSSKGKLNYRRFKDDFAFAQLGNLWTDISGAVQSRTDPKIYAVQASTSVVQRCMLMTTDPGDLVLDPSCGSGTTAYVAEQWGRRWITTDVSRVPLALGRQRLLTATYPWYELKDSSRGPAGGFVYKRRQNKKGEEIGGIVPHVTLKSIANNEPPDEEVLVDRPESQKGITRVTGPFCVESTIPAPTDLQTDAAEKEPNGEPFVNRMLEVLRKSPVLRLAGNKTVTFKNIRPPAKSLTLSAEGVIVNGKDQPVAFVFGPENGAVTERLVFDAAREAYMKGFEHLFVIGFAVEAKARSFVEKCAETVGVRATYVQATADLTMSDLLKTMRSSQIFSVCGLPDIRVVPSNGRNGTPEYRVELLGLDTFDPVEMKTQHYKGEDAAEQDKVPAWFLDTDYNGLCFHVSQAFFPRTAAWDSLKKALKGRYEDSVWDHLAGTVSEPFEAGNHNQIAVKVIDDRGNELLVVKNLDEAEGLRKGPHGESDLVRRERRDSAA